MVAILLSRFAMVAFCPDDLETCRAELGGLVVDPAGFADHVAARRPAELSDDEWLATAHLVDLYLAFACQSGVAGALERFRARHGATIHHALRGLDARARDDAMQILHQRLFVGAAPKIATYSGRGPLGAWLRVVAGRLRLELVTPSEPAANDWELAALEGRDDDPELAYLKARYRAEYKQVFAEAMARLGDRERAVLAQYHVDGLTIDQLGALYDVHRVTASRWVLRAQEQVRAHVHELLRRRLGLASTELRSVTRLVLSQLSLQLSP